MALAFAKSPGAARAKWLRIETGDHLTPFYSDESLALQKRFFDHFLKGQDNGWENEAPVMVRVRRPDGASWKKAAAWPLPGTQWDHYYLDVADDGMSPAKYGVSASEKSYPSIWETERLSRQSPSLMMSISQVRR